MNKDAFKSYEINIPSRILFRGNKVTGNELSTYISTNNEASSVVSHLIDSNIVEKSDNYIDLYYSLTDTALVQCIAANFSAEYQAFILKTKELRYDTSIVKSYIAYFFNKRLELLRKSRGNRVFTLNEIKENTLDIFDITKLDLEYANLVRNQEVVKQRVRA